MSYAVGLTIQKPAKRIKFSTILWCLIWALDIAAAIIVLYRPDIIVMGFK